MIDRWLRPLGALLILGVGAVHLQQYSGYIIKDVPTIGTLFILNSLAAGFVCLLLSGPLQRLGALGGIGLAVGSLISILVARYAGGGLFNYTEPTWRAPIIVAVALEAGAIVVLALTLLPGRRPA
jgi:hypothetical protein